MNSTNLIDEALDMRELAYAKLKAEKAVQVDMRRQHAITTGVNWNTSLHVAEEWYGIAKRMLTHAETFVWTKNTAGQVIHAAKKLPNDVPFHRAWLPVGCGFWWLGRDSPWQIRCETNRDWNPEIPEMRTICALLYSVKDDAIDGDSICFEALTLDHGEPTRGPTSVFGASWLEGETLTQFLARMKEYVDTTDWWTDASDSIGRWLMSACLWMQQKYVFIGRGHGSRGARRRAEKQEINSSVRIITLRKAEQEHHDGTGEGTPLQWRIPVTGHWRNQPYANGVIIPIWIDDHWRGPKDAPVKAPSKIIYKVAR